jgi:cobyrinic acid a,c-diamide synthase
MIGRDLSLPAFGYIPRDAGLSLESRHLGLKMAFEVSDTTPPLDLVGESCDIEAILGAAESAPPLTGEVFLQECPKERVHIGIAQDAAFCFYYQDNFDTLRSAGAALVPFSPCTDPLPEADAYYFGGGYPELHARALSSSPCRVMLRTAADRGVPVFGECGGLLYLAESVTVEGREVPMTGVLPGNAEMTGRIQALGYSEGVFTCGPSLSVPGTPIKGHEFHYSTFDPSTDARFSIRLTRGKGIGEGQDGLYSHETIGVYTHSYFTSRFAAAVVEAALRCRKS